MPYTVPLTLPGKLTRQGSPQLRWALYEAALAACRPSSPDHADYEALKARGLSHTRASLTIARKLARRSYHVLRERARRPGADQNRLRQRSCLTHRPDPGCAPPRPVFLDDHPSGQLPQLLRLPPPGGGPPKIERPESLRPE